MGEDLDNPTTFSVHRGLGGGRVADVVLWRRPSTALFLLTISSSIWFLFERAGYNFLSLVANVLSLLVIILFFWAKSASVLNRPLPPLPNMEVSEEVITTTADAARLRINQVLAVAHDIALGRNVKLFVQVVIGLWLVSNIGSLFDFLSLVYIGIVVSLTVPALYEKYQVSIDEKLHVVYKVFSIWYNRFDNSVISKVPLPLNREKKTKKTQ